MMVTQTVLSDLDKHAAEFNFPVLDNAYVRMAAARMSAFRSQDNWAVIFEVLGYSENEGSYVNDVYAFGSCLNSQGVLESSVVMQSRPEQPLIDPTTEAWIADWSDWSILVGDHAYCFRPGKAEYEHFGIVVPEESGAGSLGEAQLMRFFVAKMGTDQLFMTETALEHCLGWQCSGLNLFLQTEDWQHPDVAGEEKPSMNPAMRSLVIAMSQENRTLFQPGKVNTRWPCWEVQLE